MSSYTSGNVTLVVDYDKKCFHLHLGDGNLSYIHFDLKHLESELNRIDNQTLQGASITTETFLKGDLNCLEFTKGIYLDTVIESDRPSIFVHHNNLLFAHIYLSQNGYDCLAQWLTALITNIRQERYKTRFDAIRARADTPRTSLPVEVIEPTLEQDAPIAHRRSARLAKKTS